MYRDLIFILLFGCLSISAVYAQGDSDPCRPLLQSDADLDKVYDLSKLVFVARITPRSDINRQIYNYRIYPPVLKGSVPARGFITFRPGCRPMARDSVYVFFLNSLKEEVQGFNSAFLSLPEGGPGYTWVAEWIEGKRGGNQETEARSQEKE